MKKKEIEKNYSKLKKKYLDVCIRSKSRGETIRRMRRANKKLREQKSELEKMIVSLKWGK